MPDATPNATNFKERFSTLLQKEEFSVCNWDLVQDMDTVVLAENPYYVIAFQVFDLWSDLIIATGKMELALSEIIANTKQTAKVWDAYLVLVCRTELNGRSEFDEFANLVYNTRRTRKIIRTGLGDSLTRLDEVVKPFISLTSVRSSAKGRDPLQLLRDRMLESGDVNIQDIDKLIVVFKERGDLTNV